MNKIVVISFITIMSSCFTIAHSGELEENEAIMLIDVKSETIRHIKFGDISSKRAFRVSAFHTSARRIKSGNYYLKSIESIYVNIWPVKYKPPKSNTGKIIIAPQAVNYLGAWQFRRSEFKNRLEYSREVEFDLKILNDFVERDPSLIKYPLKIVTDMGVVLDLSWDEVLTKHSDESKKGI